MRNRTLRLAGWLRSSLCALALLAACGRACAQELPHVEHNGKTFHLIVDGQPYFVLGAQVHNSSGYSEALKAAWPALHAMHCNTVMVPVYWEAIEPKEGEFDFSTVDADVTQARAEDLHLILSWFGTWKNGAMT